MSNYLWNNFDNLKIKESDFLEIFSDKSNGPSPLWNRIYGREFSNKLGRCSDFIDENDGKFKLSKLEGYKGYNNIFPVGRILVGHTPQLNQEMQLRCNNKIGLLDYGSSQAFNKFKNSNVPIHVLQILNDNDVSILQ
jgi:hypothetical protein